MKPHPRIRKTVKWGGAVVSVLLLVAWVGSGEWWFAWTSSGGRGFTVTYGKVFTWPLQSKSSGPARTGASFGPIGEAAGMLDWSWFETGPSGTVVPLWVPAALAGVLTLGAWWLDTLARRRARIGLCPKCSYNRAGLPPQAPCPECGAAAATPS